MTRARDGAASAAHARAIQWHRLPYEQDEETGRWPNRMLPCADGDELLARVGDEVVEVTVDRRHGCAFRLEDGEAVEPDAIAERTRRHQSETEAARRAAGLHALKIRIPSSYVAKLDAICEESGYSRAETIMGMIDGEATELARLRSKPSAGKGGTP